MSRWRAERHPEETAFTWLDQGESAESDLTFEQLDWRARSIAAVLQAREAEGERVLLVQEPGLDYVASIMGCFYAGAIAVPVYPPDPFRLHRTLPRLQAILRSAEARYLLSSRKVLGEKTSPLWTMCDEEAIRVDEIPVAQWRSWRPRAADPGEIAFLQYTSGSTGTPRGVAITHANLMHNVRAMYEMWDVENAVVVHWLPPYHDMGLIGCILLPFYAGRQTILLSPLAFMQRPIRWLKAIDRYRGTTTGSPNFGYELCVRKIKPEECEGLDLSSWKIAVTGSEPIRSSTLDRFARKFGPFGFRRSAFAPAYGMAEATVVISGKERTAPPRLENFSASALRENRVVIRRSDDQDARTLVGCGRPAPQVEVAVVDPNRRTRLPSGRIGEIWVRSPGVGRGYWNLPEETSQVFNAAIEGESGGGYLRTGDLGFLHEGQLFVAGREKELIILAGRNFYPHDIEKCIQESHAALKLDGGAAFSVDVDGQEAFVVVQEVLRPKRYDLEEAARCARLALAEELELIPHELVLVPSGSLPKTSSGKLRRRACRNMYLESQLRPLYGWKADSRESSDGSGGEAPEPPQTEMEKQVAELWGDVLGMDSIGRSDDFFALGGRSLQVVQLLGRLQERFPIEAPLQILFDNPTLQAFARTLETLRDKQRADHNGDGDGRAVELARSPVQRGKPSNGDCPLSHSQRSFWFLETFGERGAFLHVPLRVRLSGPLDQERLRGALDQLVQRHEALRTRFFERDGDPVQQIAESAGVPFSTVDLTGEPPEARDDQRRTREREFIRRPFDLQQPPLIRAMLVRLSENEHVLTIVLHHIACDGWSLELLLRDVARFYEQEEEAAPPDRSPIRYVDYARWQHQPASVARWERRVGYWRERLAGAPQTLELPTDHARTAEAAQEAGVCRRELTAASCRALEKLARAHRATPFVAHLAAYQILLSRYAATPDLCVGVPTANRERPELERLVGCFINTVVLRADLRGDPRFDQLLDQTRNTVLQDLDHADVPFEKIVEALQPDRQPGRMPLVQAMLIFQSPTSPPRSIGSARISEIESDYSALAAFDVTLVVEPRDSGAAVLLVYNRGLFDEATIQRMLDGYVAILERIAESPETTLSELPVPTDVDRRRLLVDWNATDREPSAAQRVHDLVAAEARRRPEATALRWRDGRLAYGELDRRANRLAHYLSSRGVGPETPVGVHLKRSPEMVVALLAIWKAGGAYVPLDPSYPRRRLQAMASDCALPIVLTEEDIRDRLPSLDATEVLTLQSIRDRLEDYPETSPDCSTGKDQLAYIMYTSGSTGVPKGVMVTQGSVLNLLASFARRPGLSDSDRILAATTISFDISVLELFLPLSVGACAVIAQDSFADDAEGAQRLIADNGVNVLQATPSAFRLLLARGWRPAKGMKILCGGEPLTGDLADQLTANGAEVWNVYGPTETTVWSTVHRVDRSATVIPIGKPVDNTQVYVLDDAGRPAPIGVPGELHIGGAGVARGYWNRADLTSEKFIEDPFSNGRAGRLYRTGDVARWRSDGVLEFLSRRDGQVKVRGFRVELGEVEAALCRHEDVREAAVMLDNVNGSGRMLAAYYAAVPDRTVCPKRLREFLSERLPNYMVPTYFVQRDSLPRTPAGKIDRRSLPAPSTCCPTKTAAFVAPRTPLEREISELWREVLGLEQVGVDDNFFELGGHSLIAAQLFSRLRNRMGMDLPLRQFYEHPTVAAVAERIVSLRLEQGSARRMGGLLDRLESMSEEEAAQAVRAAAPEFR